MQTTNDVAQRLKAEEEDTAVRWEGILRQCIDDQHRLGEGTAAPNEGLPLLARLTQVLEANATIPAIADIRTLLAREYGDEHVASYAAAIATHVEAAAVARKRPALKGAWFIKQADGVGKDRRRWFELHGREVKYYGDVAQERGVDEKGVILISHYTVVIATGMELVITNPERAYRLTGESPGLVSEWGAALKHVMALETPQGKANALAGTADGPAGAANEVDKLREGWAVLAAFFTRPSEDGDKQLKQWFVLDGLELACYKDVKAGQPVGLVDTLTIGGDLAISYGNTSIILVRPQQRVDG